ncbi:MAG: AraC family transcriptional regulator [Gammaproteobacteria bacterium]|uniref:HTH-type transcriptional regulator VirS n=1 Tax=Marinobacter litoralis TaxID=187981 RepID=A0A3M2RBX6_9GAMM|nr:AraC family transcriptional regulator [Marinobacter litoralis]MBR9869903.1 AraC family transcriptional regulator [Gammaproteobacteria bacterium]RMJ02659.1 HTH-type transcriptional regulator VirS [Marinobacter litoralis]
MTSVVDVDEPSIPSSYSRLAARELGLLARDVSEVLIGAQLSVEQFLQESTLLTPRQQLQILRNCLRIAKDDAFGLRFGQRLTSPTHGALGFLVNSSPNLLTALKAFQAYLPTRMNLARLDLEIEGEWLELSCEYAVDLEDELLRLLSEIFTVIFFDTAEFIIGRPLREANIDFMHQKPAYAARYDEHIPATIGFGALAYVLKIPLEVCQIPNASANHESYVMALRHCDAMLAQLKPNKSTCKYQVQKMMLSHPPGVLSEEEVAAALFICKRTLARRLKQEGTSFRKVRDEILSQQAEGYLLDSTLSVEAVAELLNYHDSANFRRAFKRWFNLTPDQYRRQHSASENSVLG